MGTIQAWGFQGEINSIQWARSAPNYGAPHGVVGPSAWQPSTVPGSVRTVRLQPGTGYAHGIQVELTGTQDVVSPSVPAGTSRWDTICARYTWAAGGGTVQFVSVPGTSAQALSGSLNANPGVVFDQPIALAQFTAGQDTATSIIDLRRWASKSITSASLLALDDLPFGAAVTVGGVTYTRVLQGGSLAWSTGNPWVSAILATGWTHWNGIPLNFPAGAAIWHYVRYTKRQGIVYVEGAARYVGAPAEGQIIFTLNPGYRPEHPKLYDAGWGGNRVTQLLVYPSGGVVLHRKGNEAADYIVSFNFSYVSADL